MKIHPVSSIYLLSVLFAGGAAAAAPTPTPAAASTPPAASATELAGLVPPPDQIIVTAELPNVTDLTDGAAVQGITIEKIATSALQTTVVYRYPDGKTKVVAYQLPVGSEASGAPFATAPGPATVYDPIPAPPPVVYNYDPLYPVYQGYSYAPFAFRFNYEAGHRHWR